MTFGGIFIISIVIPAYNESKTLQKNISVIMNHVKDIECEIIIVDDGSKDDTWNIIKTLVNDFENLKGIRFSRNFGKEAALLAGVFESNRRSCYNNGFRFAAST